MQKEIENNGYNIHTFSDFLNKKTFIQTEVVQIAKTEVFHKCMAGIIGLTTFVCIIQYVLTLFQEPLVGTSKLKDVSSFLLFVVLVVEFIHHYCISQNIDKIFNSEQKHEEYVIQITEDNQDENADDDQTDNRAKIKSILSAYIKNKKELNDVASSLLDAIDVDSEIEPDENTLLPLNRDEYLPWQASVLEPQNPLSLATSISTNTINIPALSAYAPKGIPKKIEEESKGSLSMNFKGSRFLNARGSAISEMSSKAEEIAIPKLHSDYYESIEKMKSQDNFASWISFILFEEAKKMETLSMLEEEEDDELSLVLKKRSTFINIATSADQKKNFTNKLKEFDEKKFIVFDKK